MIVIHPRALFSIESLTETLGLKKGTIPRELRLGHLKGTRRAGRVWISGKQVWDWLNSGEVARRQETATNGKA